MEQNFMQNKLHIILQPVIF